MRSPVNIHTLVRLARGGDADAFGKLYDTYLDTIYRFVYIRVTVREDAEDLTEQVFVSVFQNIRHYRQQGFPFEAWLFKVARNKVIDYYRTRKSHIHLENVTNLPDDAKSPDEMAEKRLTHEAVLATIQKLPDTYQEILILKFIEEKSNHEISTILEKPIEHVRVLQSRALHKLRQLIHL